MLHFHEITINIVEIHIVLSREKKKRPLTYYINVPSFILFMNDTWMYNKKSVMSNIMSFQEFSEYTVVYCRWQREQKWQIFRKTNIKNCTSYLIETITINYVKFKIYFFSQINIILFLDSVKNQSFRFFSF